MYLISDKSKTLFRPRQKKQLNKVIKVVRFDTEVEYYRRYNESGQNKGRFALYLQECGIKAQYTTPSRPEQNGVSERRNRTMLNMVSSMMCKSGLPKFL